jgi:hypothetical protein
VLTATEMWTHCDKCHADTWHVDGKCTRCEVKDTTADLVIDVYGWY